MRSKWSTKPLGDVLELKRGYDLPKSQRKDGLIPIVSSSGVSGSHSSAMVDAPGVVTGRYGTIGKVFFLEEAFWPLNTTLYVRDFKGNDPWFISYLLQTIDYATCSDKAAVPGVNRNHLHALRVTTPDDPDEQRAIAGVLGSLDDKIDLNRRMNRTLEEMARALFKSWFVDFDPVHANAAGNPALPPDLATLFPTELKASELGEVPSGWEVKSIGEVVECVGGGTPSTKRPDYWEGGTTHWATPKDLSNLQSPLLIETTRKLTDAGIGKLSSGVLNPGTVLLSSRAPVGYLAIAAIPVGVNQGFIALKPTEHLPSQYLLLWCKSNMDIIKGQASGTTFAEISKKAFRPISMLVPPPAVTQAFSTLVGPLYDEMLTNQLQSRTLAALRDALLPKLLSGELSVAETEEAAA